MKLRSSTSSLAVLALLGSAALAYGVPGTAASAAPSVAPAAARAAAATPMGVPLGAKAVPLARNGLAAQASAYGLSASDVDQMTVSSVVPTQHNGLTDVWFQQTVNGLDVSNAMVNVAVRSDGSVFQIASDAVASAPKLADGATPKLTDVQAATRAASALGLMPTASFASSDAASGADHERELGDAGISSQPITARLVYQQDAEGALRLAWELGINEVGGQHWWQIRMDADTGQEISKNDWVDADSYNVYAPPTEAPSFGSRVLAVNPATTTASPFGWNDTNGAAGAELTITKGNNVNAYTDTNADNAPDAGSQPDGGASLAFDFPLDLTQAPSTYRPAAVANLYFVDNRMHDIMYRYGFDEAAHNFQVKNYGNVGVGNDPVLAEAQDGGGTNNANFATPSDGSSPRMQMYIFNLTTPNRDGDLDDGVIIHEYGHGVSNRLTGGGNNVGCLGNAEEAGEGWSDFYSYMLTMPNGTEPAAGRGIGTYVLGQPTSGAGIRINKYSTSTTINPETYDFIKTHTEVHDIGEVWAEMLWEVSYALIGKYGFDANLITGTSGNNRALQLVTDGLKMQPCNPGFVDDRNAILAADVADYSGADTCLLWTAFAKRGLGYSATQGSTGSATDGGQAFDLPPACLGVTLTPTATPSPVPASRTITYDLQLDNTSTNPAGITGVTATSQLGDHVTYVPGSATCGGTFDSGTKTATFPVGAMALGQTIHCQLKAVVDASPVSNIPLTDDFEPDLSAWTPSHGSGAVDWSLSTTTPHSPTHAAFSTDPATVSDQYLTLASAVTVPTGATLSFWQNRNLESTFDGGVVEVSTNGGTTWTDIGAAAFSQNGYNATINSTFDNPIGGRQAFSGDSNGYVQSTASLAAYVGQSVLIRFRTASDDTASGAGWNIDDVTIGNVVSTTNALTVQAATFPSQSKSLVTTIVPAVITVADAPTVTGSTPATGAVSVAFTPGYNGGSVVTGFTAECVSTDGGVTGTATGSASPISVTGLTAGKSYHCHVKATNGIGDSAFSGFGTTVLVPVAPPTTTAPAAPVITSEKAQGKTNAVVVFTPGATGGSPITSYAATCTSSNGGATKTTSGAGSPLKVTHLSAGKKYTCTVAATNAVGTGPASAPGKAFKLKKKKHHHHGHRARVVALPGRLG